MGGKGIDFAKQTNIYKERKKKRALMKGGILSAVMLALVAGAWGGTFYYKSLQEKKVTEIEAQIEQEKQSRDFEGLADVLTVASKLNFVSEFSMKQKVWSEFLSEIERKTLGAIYLKSFEGSSNFEMPSSGQGNTVSGQVGLPNAMAGGFNNNEEKINLEIVGNNLIDISKQITAFSEMEEIKSVSIGEISLQDEGLSFDLVLELDPHALDQIFNELKKHKDPNV